MKRGDKVDAIGGAKKNRFRKGVIGPSDLGNEQRSERYPSPKSTDVVLRKLPHGSKKIAARPGLLSQSAMKHGHQFRLRQLRGQHLVRLVKPDTNGSRLRFGDVVFRQSGRVAENHDQRLPRTASRSSRTARVVDLASNAAYSGRITRFRFRGGRASGDVRTATSLPLSVTRTGDLAARRTCAPVRACNSLMEMLVIGPNVSVPGEKVK